MMTYHNISTVLYQAKNKFLSWIKVLRPQMFSTLSRKYYQEADMWHEDIADFITTKLKKLMNSHPHCFDTKVWADNTVKFCKERACVFSCLCNFIVDKWRKYVRQMKALDSYKLQTKGSPSVMKGTEETIQSKDTIMVQNKEEDMNIRRMVLKEIIDSATEDELYILDSVVGLIELSRKNQVQMPSGKVLGYAGFADRRSTLLGKLQDTYLTDTTN